MISFATIQSWQSGDILWLKIEEVLGKEHAKMFEAHYYVKPEGNCDLSRMSDPHGEFLQKNVPIERQSIADTAAKFGKTEQEVMQYLGQCRAELHAYRSCRPHPRMDDKVKACFPLTQHPCVAWMWCLFLVGVLHLSSITMVLCKPSPKAWQVLMSRSSWHGMASRYQHLQEPLRFWGRSLKTFTMNSLSQDVMSVFYDSLLLLLS
jgi:hypothetical protein